MKYIILTLLSAWPSRPEVELVTTDGFLYPNRLLEERGLMQRKGFPQSYDLHRLISFLTTIKAGVSEVEDYPLSTPLIPYELPAAPMVISGLPRQTLKKLAGSRSLAR